MIQHTIQSLFANYAEETPDNIAILFEGQSLTYRELNNKSNQYAHYLQEIGVKPDTQVALCMERSIDLLIAMLGILKAGGAYVPLDPTHPTARLIFVLHDSKTPILIIHSALEKKMSRYHGKLLIFNDPEVDLETYPKSMPPQNATPSHLAYVIYTSGSTGKPKGVLIERHSVVSYALWFADYSSSQPQDRIDFSSNYVFDMAVTTSLVALMLGLTVVICSDEIKKDTQLYLHYLQSQRIKIIKTTPSYLKTLLHEVKHHFIALPDLKTLILGGENLPAIDCASWLGLYPEQTLFNEYGPTETTIAISQYPICTTNINKLTVNAPIGKPSPSIDCHILTAEGKPVEDGDIGELYIGGNCLARGYLNQPELTQERFIANPFDTNNGARLYKTGDLCRRLPNGDIECIGRADHQIKIGGFLVEPSEIEQCLVTHSAIKDAVVLAQKNNNHEKQLIAYYILENGDAAPTVKQIRKYLEAHLPHYMIPTAFVRVDSFPLNANGKLDREALPIPQFVTNQHYQAPKTPIEIKLAKIWADELGLKVVGIEDDFFELGGYSLSAARVISSIRHQLGKELSLQDFYQASNIKALINKLETADHPVSNNTQSNSIKYRPNALMPLSDFQLLIWLCNNFEPNAQKLNIIIRKRVEGKLNLVALHAAFEQVFKKHTILFSEILTYRPAQKLRQNLSFIISAIDLQTLPEQQYEATLNDSINALLYYHPWPKDMPLLMAKLFHLQNDTDELQISMSHLVSDYISAEILMADLSAFYIAEINQQAVKLKTLHKPYQDYISNEQHYFQTHLDKDILFWEDYFKDTALIGFPSVHVVPNMESQNLPYSSYLELPEQGLTNLQQFCAANYISINDGLTAALLLALLRCCDEDATAHTNQKQPIFVSMVKSTREDQNFDNTIGCFLRVESIKVSLNKTLTLAALSKQIHHATIDTAPHQQCSSLVKIASVSTFYQKAKRVRSYLIHSFTYVYTKFLRALKLNRKILNLCGRLALYERDNHFIININVQPTILANNKRKNKSNLFGLKLKPIDTYPCDLLKTYNVFDVCFLRDDNQNTPYVVISANLKPAFREQIAKEMVQIISVGASDTTHQEPHLEHV